MKEKQLVRLVQQVSALESAGVCERVPGLFVYRATQPTQIEAMIYEPIVCLILQGRKETTVGDQVVHLVPGQCLVVGHDLPVLARITRASVLQPYLSLVIRLDMDVLRSLERELESLELSVETARSIEVAPVDDATIGVLERYVALLNDPIEAQVLLPLVRKELHFRLFMSASGAMLRSLLHRGSHASSIARAIEVLRRDFRSHLDVPGLAKVAGMSASAFHRYFKAMTMTTPLQYLKDLRLTEARRLLQSGQRAVSAAAFEVGYESPSQFSREYSRKFGTSPRGDLPMTEGSGDSVYS